MRPKKRRGTRSVCWYNAATNQKKVTWLKNIGLCYKRKFWLKAQREQLKPTFLESFCRQLIVKTNWKKPTKPHIKSIQSRFHYPPRAFFSTANRKRDFFVCFSSTDTQRRLCETDAEYVDVIHTDSGILGFPRSLGHADFYPNGGKAMQPGCSTTYTVDLAGYCKFCRRPRPLMFKSLPSPFVPIFVSIWLIKARPRLVVIDSLFLS